MISVASRRLQHRGHQDGVGHLAVHQQAQHARDVGLLLEEQVAAGGSATTTRGSASARMASTSRAESRLLTAPYMTSANSGPLAPMNATRSPGRTSLRRSARAT